MILVVCLALAFGLVVVGLATSWSTARAAAVSIALSRSAPGPGLADSSWGEQLGRPSQTDLEVAIAGLPELAFPADVVFPILLANTTNQQVPALHVTVTTRLTLKGWEVVGYGVGG